MNVIFLKSKKIIFKNVWVHGPWCVLEIMSHKRNYFESNFILKDKRIGKRMIHVKKLKNYRIIFGNLDLEI